MSTLFTAVSVEQQEIVAGGFDLAAYITSYKATVSGQEGFASSGVLGSYAWGKQNSLVVDTNAKNLQATNAPLTFVA